MPPLPVVVCRPRTALNIAFICVGAFGHADAICTCFMLSFQETAAQAFSTNFHNTPNEMQPAVGAIADNHTCRMQAGKCRDVAFVLCWRFFLTYMITLHVSHAFFPGNSRTEILGRLPHHPAIDINSAQPLVGAITENHGCHVQAAKCRGVAFVFFWRFLTFRFNLHVSSAFFLGNGRLDILNRLLQRPDFDVDSMPPLIAATTAVGSHICRM